MAGAALGVTGFTVAQQAQAPTVIRLGGATRGWQGRAPEPISGQTNPTLNLVEGKQYVVVWENVDGQPHNFAIQGTDGGNLPVLQPIANNTTADNETIRALAANNTTAAGNLPNLNATGNETGGEGMRNLLVQTPIISTQGNVQAVAFQATSQMSQYICLVHPNTMVGNVRVDPEGGL